VLPGTAKEKPNQGEIVAIGAGKVLENGDLRPLAVKVGDKVVFGQYAGSNTIEVDGEELIIMGESEIYAVVE
jgi:chaperonin GroES